MRRDEKAALITAIQERFERASVALVATNRGLSVEQANRLRRAMRAAGGEYKVAKHTLVRRAVDQTRYGGLSQFLRGPRGLVFGYEDPVVLTKAVVTFAKEVDRLDLEGGAVEGQVIGADQVEALATMPSLGALRMQVVRQALTPGSRIASMATGPGRRIAGAIQTLTKKLESAGPA